MTLLTTEIHNHQDPNGAMIVFASDRRITAGAGKYHGSRKKIFQVPWLSAGIGYFGIAQVHEHGKTREMQNWVESFLSRATRSVSSLGELSQTLSDQLNVAVPLRWRTKQPSGFHLAGFVKDKPEFWFVRNVNDQGRVDTGLYSAREDFQSRDAKSLPPGEVMIYRNGDLRAHVTAWEALDKAFGPLLKLSDFRTLKTPGDYEAWVRFKMEVIAYAYKTFSCSPIIGRPIDVFSIKSPLRSS